jgi:phosphonate transport system permease protein
VNRDLLLGAVLLCVMLAAMAPLGLFDAPRLLRGASNLALFAAGVFPPDLGILPLALGALVETIEMAVAGTLLGFFIAVPLGFLGSRVLAPPALRYPTKVLVGAIRAVPSLLWAVVFVIVVGLGPLSGALALAVYTVGTLAKLYAEFYEAVDPEILEAVRGVGARPLHIARFVILPESANNVLSQLIYTLEYNIRASSILGLVGAGGIGFYLNVYISTLEYRRVATVILVILVLVLVMDLVSSRLRRQYRLTSS